MKDKSHLDTFGFISENPKGTISKEDKQIQKELQKAIQASKHKKQIAIDWPCISEEPVDEYCSKKIFCLAYPWLFPGGIGDVKDYGFEEKNKLGAWGEMMLRYQDGRFQKDNFFCFFALNYITRHRNAGSSNWFIKNFNQGGPETLDDLKECIKNGDTKFVNRLTYFNQHVKGSTSFWHQKRAELYTWINHHVEEGNGPPMFFITLSCFEHH